MNTVLLPGIKTTIQMRYSGVCATVMSKHGLATTMSM